MTTITRQALDGLIAEHCDAIANQAEALKISPLRYRASAARRIRDNAETLLAWCQQADEAVR